MAIINGIQLLHKRYADWSSKTLQAGELGLNLTTLEVRIGTAANQSWENASVVSCKVEIQGEGKHIVDASYENGKLIISKGTINYNDLANTPELNFDAKGTAASAVSAHNSAADAHADIRKDVSDNAAAIAKEVEDREDEITRVEGLVTAEADRASKAETALQQAVDAKVAQSDYDTKVGELVAEDQRLAGLINTEKERVDGIIADYETKATAEGKYLQINTAASTYETIAEVNKVRGRVQALEQAALSGLSREIVTQLPAVADALDNVIYMIKRPAGLNQKDVYDEYLLVLVDGAKQFELLGNTEIDLSNYYTKGQVDAAIDADVLVVSNALNQEVSDRTEAVKGVQGQLDIIKGEAEGSIKKAVADEAALREAADTALGNKIDAAVDRIDALEELDIDATYAKKEDVASDIQSVVKAIADEASRASNAEGVLERAVDALEEGAQTLSGNLSNLSDKIDTIQGTGAGSIAKAVADEAALREEADTALGNRVGDLEKITYSGTAPISVTKTGSNVTVAHNTSGVVKQESLGFFAFKVNEYGHITGVEAITTLDGNAE